ncbi:MAG: hypothetical protein L6R36_005350 [Xanthoria steineri]|nr:MAG: hypothetical protein L6R36_005350 [Xanthoria steineri]
MPFNPFKSSSSKSSFSKSSSFTPSSSTPPDTTFPPQYITCALAADMLERLDPITFANITAADTQRYLTIYKAGEDSQSWIWISATFPFQVIHDALSSFPSHSLLPNRTKKSLEAFVKHSQKTASELVAHVFKKEGKAYGEWFVAKKGTDKESDFKILERYMHERVKAPQPVEDD